jgi:DNA topoisomerase-3
MGKVLVIAEKPSVGRELAKILGCKKQGNGCLIGDKHIVSWAIGHLVTLCEPQDYDPELKRWNFADLPILPRQLKIKPVENTIQQYNILARLMQDEIVESLVCATDSGREGELIFRYIYHAAACEKPFKRLWISSMTTKAINDGFKKMKDGSAYDNLYDSARCRSEADWLVGINASRAFSIKYDALLPIGRVQSPTLALIVERQAEIDDFKPLPYWEVEAEFEDFKAIWFDPQADDSSKILKQEAAKKICELISDKTAITSQVKLEKKSQPAPLLYDLTELQRDANKKYGYSAQNTLSIAQNLYEKKKMITYPRTDSRYISDDMKETITNTLKHLQVEPFKAYAEHLLALDKLPFSKRIINNKKITDHHAIIPAETTPNLNRLSPEEKNIYNLIVKRFFAVFYPKYRYSITRITMQVETEQFMARGKTVIDWGWKYFYKNETKQNEQVLPKIQKGDTRPVTGSEILEKKTSPPKAYNEASLLSAMENAGRFVEDDELKEQLKDNGLGTPATRASIIERLLQVKYIRRKGKSLAPTDKGKKLISVMPSALKSPEFTGKWERGLSSIAKGELEAERFMEAIENYVRKVIILADNKPGKVRFENKNRQEVKDALATCPRCEQGSILENEKSFYCSEWRRGCKFSIWKTKFSQFGINFDRALAVKLLQEKKINGLEVTFAQDKKPGEMDIELGKKGIIKISRLKKR